MTVMYLRSLGVPVLQPFLELELRADLHGRQAVTSLPALLAETAIRADNFGGRDAVIEQVADDLHVHCRSAADTCFEWMLALGNVRPDESLVIGAACVCHELSGARLGVAAGITAVVVTGGDGDHEHH